MLGYKTLSMSYSTDDSCQSQVCYHNNSKKANEVPSKKEVEGWGGEREKQTKRTG